MLTALILSAVVAGIADPKVDQVASDFRALSRIASLANNLNDSRQVMLAIVDNDLENLRERRPDETYRWASLQREEASRVKDQKSIERVSSEKELREVTLTAPNAYRLEVSVPTKQSLISKNNRVYIRNVLVDSTGFDGKITHHEIPVDAWVNPGDANGVALPEIGKSVRATVERRRLPSGTIGAGDASPDVLSALQEISRLLGGNLQDQTDARTRLQALLTSLQPKS